jgi:hypothetical protein
MMKTVLDNNILRADSDEAFMISPTVCGMRENRYHNTRAQNAVKYLAKSGGKPIVNWGVFNSMVDQGFTLDAERDNKSVLNPQHLWDALDKYGTRTKFQPNRNIMKHVYGDCMLTFGSKSPSLVPLEGKFELFDAIKLDKASGAPEFKKKREAFVMDYPRMVRIREGSRNPDPCVCAARIQHGEEGPKTRLVWSYPLPMTMLEAMYARPLIEHYLRAQTPMAFGRYRWELVGNLQKIENHSVRLGLDFSSFDSSIHPYLIDVAFKVLRSHFPKSESIDRDFRTIVQYFIHTPIVMSDGNIYRKHKGVPSGSYFTQLIDSIVNYAAISYAAMSCEFKFVRDSIKVLGDDSIVGIDRDVDIEQISSALTELGLTVNVNKSAVRYFGQPMPFLGHDWHHGSISREMQETAKRLVFPEKPWPPNLSHHDYILMRMYASLADSEEAWLLFRNWSFVRSNVIARYFGKFVGNYKVDHGWSEFMSEIVETEFGEKDVYNVNLAFCYMGLMF